MNNHGYTYRQVAELRVSEPYGHYLRAHGTHGAHGPELDEAGERNALEYADRVLGMFCGRCNQRTGNNSQGHYWAFCKVTGGTRTHHFCCPGDCELEATPTTPEETS